MSSRDRRRASKLQSSAALDAILEARDRDRIPGARPVVALDSRDEAAFLDAVEARTIGTAVLQRRGAWHGEWAELDPKHVSSRARTSSGASRPNEEHDSGDGSDSIVNRWHAARPIVLAAAAADLLEAFAEDLEGAEELHAELAQKGGLQAWLARCAEALEPGFVPLTKRAPLFDRERDIDRVFVRSLAPGSNRASDLRGSSGSRGSRGREIGDLWLKTSWLSTHEDDASLRLRLSFGREVDDDASRDILRHRLVAELTSILLPESALITENPRIAPIVERLCGEDVLFTQGIAYWNSPNGGALFHHDAFGEDRIDGGDWRQLGVCYLQLSGRTAWLALSIEDLGQRVREFFGALDRGEKAWVRAQLFEAPRAGLTWARLRALVDDDALLLRELSLPGCGGLGPLVNRGPEFTAFLAQKGHALILQPGDAILLPNQGVHATCMHSVFCAGEDTGYSLSLAIRPDREAPEVALERSTSRHRGAEARTRRGS